jgi:EAL domain-containing protein (putative c-di-GMP-specific phosphodiesterase class I)
LNIGANNISITRILKEENHQENLLSKLASSSTINLPTEVWVEVLEKSNMDKEELVAPLSSTLRKIEGS